MERLRSDLGNNFLGHRRRTRAPRKRIFLTHQLPSNISRLTAVLPFYFH